MLKIDVKNIPNTGSRLPPGGYDSWIEYWRKNTNTAVKLYGDRCVQCGSAEKLDGVHVKKINSTDQKEYIVPLCPSCNHPTNEDAFKVDEGVLVSIK